jgi:hypothetical protein
MFKYKTDEVQAMTEQEANDYAVKNARSGFANKSY